MKKLWFFVLISGFLTADLAQNGILNILSLGVIEAEVPELYSSEENAKQMIDAFFNSSLNVDSNILISKAEKNNPSESNSTPFDALDIHIQDKLNDISTHKIEESYYNANESLDETSYESKILTDSEDMQRLESEVNGEEPYTTDFAINFKEVFAGSPIIYILLASLSLASLILWLNIVVQIYTCCKVPKEFINRFEKTLVLEGYTGVLNLCKTSNSLISKMTESALLSKNFNQANLFELMKSEGKKLTQHLWQKNALLNDIAMLSPMIGLLGTILGMFYAFYDLNRSVESLQALYDGLGVSVATTAAGLSVAIQAMLLFSISRYMLIKQLTYVEDKADELSKILEGKPDI
jgi:biopolymer transport protein ExbB